MDVAAAGLHVTHVSVEECQTGARLHAQAKQNFGYNTCHVAVGRGKQGSSCRVDGVQAGTACMSGKHLCRQA